MNPRRNSSSKKEIAIPTSNLFSSPVRFYRPSWVEINHANLHHNFKTIRSILSKKTSVLAVIKANAYGHGMISVARSLKEADFFGVTSLEEALALRSAKISTPPLILGNIYPFSNLELAIRNDVRITVASLESARQCENWGHKLRRKVYVHAKIDTGMGRMGVHVQNSVNFIERILEHSSIVLEGVYMHFASSADDPVFTKQQHHLFEQLLKELNVRGIHIPYVHCANSSAIFKYPQFHHDLVRPGISLYGISPVVLHGKLNLKPVLSWKSRIVYLKDVPSQTPIGYNTTFFTRRRSRIATAAFGYADGFRRSLSNAGHVLVQGRKVPVVGRVTMDMTMLDVTGVPNVRVGDEVVLIGTQGKESIPVQEVAQLEGTSPYEVFCNIHPRVPRVDVR